MLAVCGLSKFIAFDIFLVVEKIQKKTIFYDTENAVKLCFSVFTNKALMRHFLVY